MVRLAHVTTRASGPEAYLVSLSDVLYAQTAAGPRIFTVSGKGGGVMALDPLNGMAVLGQAPFASGGSGLDAPRFVLPATVAGQPGLLVFGRYAASVEAYTLDAAGRPVAAPNQTLRGEGVASVAMTAAATASIGSTTYVITADRQTDGLSVWSQGGGNRLNRVVQTGTAEVFGAADILSLTTVFIGGEVRVLALAAGSDGLYDLRLGASGQITQVGRLGQQEGLAASIGTVVEVVTLAGRTYALVGAAGSGTLSVIEMLAGGGLALRDQVLDELDTRFAGLVALATATVAGQVFVAVAGADDGVTLMTLLPGGRLLHLSTLAHETGMAMANPTGLALVPRGTGLDLFVTGGAGTGLSGVTQLRAELGAMGAVVELGPGGQTHTGGAGRDVIVGGSGNDVIRGGAGDDILVDGAGRDTLFGGAGADVFVLLPDGETDWIMDFEPGIDRLDLSALARFYTMDAISFTPTATGAEIVVGGERTIITRADGRTLRLSDIGIKGLRDLTHLGIDPVPPPAAEPPPNLRLMGTAGPDTLIGGAGDDTLEGGAGGDLLIGGAGHDLLIGGNVRNPWDIVAGQVYRLYQAALAREPDVPGLLHWHDRLTSGAQTLTQVAQGFVGSAEFQRVYGSLDTAAYVTLLYHNVLGRGPDPLGFAHWTGLLNTGALTRPAVLTGFSESMEFRRITDPAGLAFSGEGLRMGFADDVFRLYRGVLGRDPDLPGLLHWADLLTTGTTYLSVVAGFVGSAEFQRVYGTTTDAAFVTLLYQNMLGRAPDPVGFAHWMGLLGSGAQDRTRVVEAFAQSTEFTLTSAGPLKAWMRGRGIEDTLDGGAGDDVLFGGMLADRFVFRADAPGSDRVIGFEPWDQVQLSGFGFANAAAARAQMQQVGNAVVFEHGDVRVVFENTPLAVFADDVFVF